MYQILLPNKKMRWITEQTFPIFSKDKKRSVIVGVARDITQIFKKLKQARAISVVKKVDGKYVLNEKLWAKAIDFLKEIKKWQELG